VRLKWPSESVIGKTIHPPRSDIPTLEIPKP